MNNDYDTYYYKYSSGILPNMNSVKVNGTPSPVRMVHSIHYTPNNKAIETENTMKVSSNSRSFLDNATGRMKFSFEPSFLMNSYHGTTPYPFSTSYPIALGSSLGKYPTPINAMNTSLMMQSDRLNRPMEHANSLHVIASAALQMDSASVEHEDASTKRYRDEEEESVQKNSMKRKKKPDGNIDSKQFWNHKEDQLLMQSYNKVKDEARNPKSNNDEVTTYESVSFWYLVSKGVPGRSTKQCRERWMFNLDPSINHENWKSHEDEMMLLSRDRLGNHWSKIAEELPGRTENQVKSRFRSIECAQKSVFTKEEDDMIINACGGVENFHKGMENFDDRQLSEWQQRKRLKDRKAEINFVVLTNEILKISKSHRTKASVIHRYTQLLLGWANIYPQGHPLQSAKSRENLVVGKYDGTLFACRRGAAWEPRTRKLPHCAPNTTKKSLQNEFDEELSTKEGDES